MLTLGRPIEAYDLGSQAAMRGQRGGSKTEMNGNQSLEIIQPGNANAVVCKPPHSCVRVDRVEGIMQGPNNQQPKNASSEPEAY